MASLKWLIPALLIGLSFTVVSADDLTGSNSFLCAISAVTSCPLDEECATVSAWKANVPQFILVDLDEKTLATTEASGQNRVSPIPHLVREDGLIILQGSEMGRAFSFTIAEETGQLTATVALDGEGVVGFGACTPSPVK